MNTTEGHPQEIKNSQEGRIDKREKQEEQGEFVKDKEIEEKFYSRLNGLFDDYYLSALQRAAMIRFIQTQMTDRQNKNVERIRQWLLAKINGHYVKPADQGQKGCPDIIPGLRAQPWWDSTDFPWLKSFEDNYAAIREELLTLRSKKGFQPYRGPSWISNRKAEDGIGNQSIDSGSWNVFYLQLHNLKFDANCSLVPLTMRLIEQNVPNNYHHAFFSALTTKSHILSHYGPTNKKLRMHLPLCGVSGSQMRVGYETRQQVQGKAYVFDDSFEHEAWHDGDETRLILIVDFWHPDLTQLELKFLKILQNARFKAEAIYSEMDPTEDNFYSIIEHAKDILKDNNWWIVAGAGGSRTSTLQQSLVDKENNLKQLNEYMP